MRKRKHQRKQQLKSLFIFLAGSLTLACSLHSFAAAQPSASAIASAHPLATEAGHQILAQGGNAFDAAVAVSATLAVVEPAGSGLGGGGFWLLHRAADGHQVMLDGRERAPLAASKDMYLDAQGLPVAERSLNGALAAGIPGLPAALVHLAKHYGSLPLARSLAPAIALADSGFEVGERYHKLASFRLSAMQADAVTAATFLVDNQPPAIGHLIKQPDLANTLRAIAQRGHDGFYRGEVANKLLTAVKHAGGIWQAKDLKRYQVVERRPIYGHYHGIRVVSAPPPSSGGIALVSMLNILSEFPLPQMDPLQRSHTMVEAMRHAYRDRAEYLGDSDFVPVPIERLTSLDHADQLRSYISPDQSGNSQLLKMSKSDIRPKGEDTTHFSIIDQQGNRVAATLSINYPFGAAFMAAGTGVLLNNEMDDFSVKPGTPNAYGLVGAAANAIAPGKRPLSSMTPTFWKAVTEWPCWAPPAAAGLSAWYSSVPWNLPLANRLTTGLAHHAFITSIYPMKSNLKQTA